MTLSTHEALSDQLAPAVAHGYTLNDIDAMARAACRADRSLASDAHTRYGVAWSAIGMALAEAPHWPTREWLVQVGWQAIYAEVRQMRHTFGMVERGDVASSPRFREFWWHGTTSFEDGLLERLSVAPIMATLTDTERAAVLALAVHDDYGLAADALGIGYTTLTVRLTAARRRFYRRWYYPETPPRIRGNDRRVEVRGKPLDTHCGAGHEWTPENTRPRKGQKGRDCRSCERARVRPSRAKVPA